MSQFVKTLEDVIKQQTSSAKQNPHSITINRIEFQKLQPETRQLFQSYRQLQLIRIINCDLRTLDNFPVIDSLRELCVANNSLQGSVENLVKLENLQYLDLSYNLVREAARLSPLKKIHGLTVCVVGNRFLEIDGWKAILDGYRLTVEKQPRDLTNEKKQEPHPEPVQDKSPMNKFAQECPSPVVEYDLNFRQVGRRGGMRSGRPLATAAELIPNRLERGLQALERMGMDRGLRLLEDLGRGDMLHSEQSDRNDQSDIGLNDQMDVFPDHDEQQESNNTFQQDDDSDSSNVQPL